MLTAVQWGLLAGLAGVLVAATALWPYLVTSLGWLTGVFGFLAVSAWRVLLTLVGRPPADPVFLNDDALPRYTLICPLYREARMVPSLLQALQAVDYPSDRLEIILALEADDLETQAAVASAAADGGVRVLVAPPGAPKTKPRACNIALNHAHGELLVIYDAEDRPHPLQLREAAARFAEADDELVCLQAPLRILPRRSFFQRQFAMEYAAQFEVALHAMARLSLPFPLGGTSNHFRVDRLREVGGWDAWNVTEDADLGFRFAARGWRIGTLRRPTTESAPDRWRDWLPQRTRWLKGYLQTLIVWTRRPPAGGPRMAFALLATVGLSVVSATVHGLAAFWMATWTLGWALFGRWGDFVLVDGIVLMTGWWSFCLMARRGARRAGFDTTSWDYVCALAYWPLLTWAAGRALWHLLTRPHLWEKTPHTPPDAPIDWTRCEPAD